MQMCTFQFTHCTIKPNLKQLMFINGPICMFITLSLNTWDMVSIFYSAVLSSKNSYPQGYMGDSCARTSYLYRKITLPFYFLFEKARWTGWMRIIPNVPSTKKKRVSICVLSPLVFLFLQNWGGTAVSGAHPFCGPPTGLCQEWDGRQQRCGFASLAP